MYLHCSTLATSSGRTRSSTGSTQVCYVILLLLCNLLMLVMPPVAIYAGLEGRCGQLATTFVLSLH